MLEMKIRNNVITIASIDDYKEKELRIDINENLELHSDCCIYKVPKDLRKIKKAAYSPQVISIGLLHHGKQELRDMEKQKIRYKREFSKRITTETWQKFVSYIEVHEKSIRNCYAEIPKFSKLKILTMILYDAVFIIEHFLRNFESKRDFLLDKPRVRSAVMLDLLLLENQLPYFVLNELYRLAYPNQHNSNGLQYPTFFSLCCRYFKILLPTEIFDEVEVKHFTDLARHITTRSYPKPQSRKCFTNLPCSVKLQESGVKFKVTNNECMLDVKFVKKKLRIPWFQVNELQIPCIEISDPTESLIRNMMAFEQCHYPCETLVCNYIDLMDNLINTEEDVNLLVEEGIIINLLGDSASIAKMFNKLCLQIDVSKSCYWKIEEDLQAHYSNPWNHTKATLKRVYFSNYWRGTGTIAAIVLLLLTLIQTICSILQVV